MTTTPSTEPAAERTLVRLFLNRPMMPQDRHQLEDHLVQPMLDHLAPGATVVGGGTYGADEGGPLACDIQLEFPASGLEDALRAVAEALREHGMARGSFLEVGDERIAVGDDELVLLYTGAPWGPSEALDRFVDAVRSTSLGDGTTGWLEGAFPAGAGETVLVLSGSSAERILAAVRAELPTHPEFPSARMRSISPDAAESDPLN